MAVDLLKSRGVPEEHILFLNVIASPEGVTSFAQRYPKLRVVTAFVDQGLDEKKWVPAFVVLMTANVLLGTLFPDWEILGTVSILYEK